MLEAANNSNNIESKHTTTIPAGTYVFPFHVQLPPSLPSSTYYPTHDNRPRSKMRFRIQYKLVATLCQPGGSKRSSSCCQKYLWIRAAEPDPPPPVTPCLLEPVAQTVPSRGLFRGKAGLFLFGAAVENCNLSNNGDFIQLHVACRNDSSTPMERVQIQVLERLQWGTATKNNAVTTVVDEQTGRARRASAAATLRQTDAIALVTLRDVQLPGLAAARERKGVLQSVVGAIMGSGGNGGKLSQQQQLQRQVYDDLVSGQHRIRIQLPSSTTGGSAACAVRESYSGQLVQIHHVLRIEFQAAAALRHQTPVVEIPLHVTGSARPLLLTSGEGGRCRKGLPRAHRTRHDGCGHHDDHHLWW